MFFSKNRKQNALEILSCVDGDVVPLDEVPDEIFKQHPLGEGIAINPENETVFAPCEGKITHISESGHVIGITCENGFEFIIHVGIDTAGLLGDGFETLTRVHDHVYTGTPILSFDLAFIKEKGLCPYVVMLGIQKAGYDIELEKEKGHVQANEDVLFTITTHS